MDTISLRGQIDRMINIDTSILILQIEKSGFSCRLCGWCCCRNFDIRITAEISRPSNAISIFPEDIRRIIKHTGCTWDEVVEPDIYSLFQEGSDVKAVGWILRRNDDGNCTFYRKGLCSIYAIRPLICRCYPFFMGKTEIEIMYCNGLGKNMTVKEAAEILRLLKRYEIKKLKNYIKIIGQMESTLKISNLKSFKDFSGEVLVFDGETISKCIV